MQKILLQLFFAVFMSAALNAQAVPVTITGTGTGGWVQPGNLVLKSTDGIVWTANNFEIVGDGNMKFSEGGTWATTGGYSTDTPDPGFPSGKVTINGGKNIVGTLGFWNVTYNITTKEYTFTPGVNPNPVVVINGGGLAADVQMNTSNGMSYFKKSVTFPGGDASFKETSPNTGQWGGAFPDGPAVNGGTIPVPAGTFNTYFVLPTNASPAEFVFEPVVVSIIGNFAGSAWNTDLDLETTDNVIFKKSGWAPVINPGWNDGELHLKFRDNHDWTYQFGCEVDSNGGNKLALVGTAKKGNAGGGGDIFIPWPAPNSYDVTFDRSIGKWTFTVKVDTKNVSLSDIKVSPNPTNSNWNFELNENVKVSTIYIVDILGKVVSKTDVFSNNVSVNASQLKPGIYFAKFGSVSVKLIKK